MTIPNSKEFEDALGAVEVTSEVPQEPYDILYNPDDLSPLQRKSGPISDLRRLYLRYPEGTIGRDALLKKVQVELRHVGCISNTRIAIAVLGLIAETKPSGATGVEHANNFFGLTVEANLHQILVLPNFSKNFRPETYDLEGISYEIFNPKKMLYWSDKSHPGIGQERFPIDLKSLKRNYSLRRDPPLDVRIIDFFSLDDVTDSPLSQRPALEVECGIWGNYLEAVFDYYAKTIEKEVIKGACLIEAAGTQYFDQSVFRSFLTTTLGLFCWEAPQGLKTWAVQNYCGGYQMNSPGIDPFLNFDRWLEDTLGFRGYSGKTSFLESVRSYSRFLQRAQRHKWNDRHDEAYLHFVIALDMIFGMEGRAVQTVKSRAATLVHRQCGLTIEEQIKRVDKIYAARSNYVHGGLSILGIESLEEVEQICIQVLWCLLIAENNGEFENIDEYTAAIDYINAALGADHTVEEQTYARVGIPPNGEPRLHDKITVDDTTFDKVAYYESL